MKKIKKYKVFVISIIIIGSLAYYFLFWFNFDKGDFQYSEDMKQSYNKGVFLQEYKSDKDSIKIDYNTYIKFEEIWGERIWFLGNRRNTISHGNKSKFSLIIKVSSNSFQNYLPHEILMEDNSGNYFGVVLIGNQQFFNIFLNMNQLSDTIKCRVKNLKNLKSIYQPVYSDSFNITKKNL